MFLKRLELVGFKSFAERLNIDFVKGITAVVGPNGSGKSNISDAIRWVLGEQSAKNLRGSKMEDIIFSGSDSRKPLNMAEITLVLDNYDQHLPIDYSEVAVTRRVFRSGDSEYLINKQPCRLRDIVDLFMDSGLGKESFSIIGQGRVEEILSSKPEERRAIFEEAAGVLKYKNRKLKSEKKLSDTQDNLNRVKDIIYELESQIDPLEEQASIAKDYVEKKAELKDYEVGVLAKEIEQFHEKWTDAKTQVEDLQDKEGQAQAMVRQYEAQLEKLRVDMQKMDMAINDRQDILLTVSEEVEKQEGQKEVWKERKKNFAQHREKYLLEIAELKEKKEELSKKVKVDEMNVAQNEKKVVETQKSLKEKEKELELLEKSSAEKLELLKSDYIEEMNNKASYNNEMAYLEDQIKRNELKQNKKDEDNREWLRKREEILTNLQESKVDLVNEQEELMQLLQEYSEKKSALEKGKKSQAEKENVRYEANHHLRQLTSRKSVLEEMENEYSGFYQGVKEILKERDRQFKGIQGAIAELIRVDAKFQVAIDIALGAAQQHVVVTDEATGRNAIQFLKERRLGRATFLPMDVIRPRTVQEGDKREISKLPGFVGLAKDLVDYDQPFENIMSYLLGHIVVVTDMKAANAIARTLRYRHRIVTLEGDIINPGGTMTGGSVKQNKSQILGRKQEIEQLSAKIDKVKNEIDALEEELTSWQDTLNILEQEMAELQKSGEKRREIEQSKKSAVKELELLEQNINERLEIYDMEKDEFQEDVNEKKKRHELLVQNIEKSSRVILSLNKEIEQLSKLKEATNTSREALSEHILNLKVKLAKEEEQLYYSKENFSQFEARLRQVSESLLDKETEFFTLEHDMNEQSEHGDTLDALILEKRKERDAIVQRISNQRGERLILQQTHDDGEMELKEHRRQLKFISSTLHEAEVKVNRLDVELDNRLQTLQEEYELSYDGAKEQYPLQTDLSDAKEKVKLIKLAMDELGVVNVGAIEEHARVKERYDFLQKQKNDLEGAKATLHQVIEEMDEEMMKRFKDTFDHIQEHFHTVFQELFGGGQADLILLEPNDLLNTGVDIVAQPPGKNLQNLALLSGGERALTAIALLFSILKVRPVPFCVLDEVEAALDEANVVRFAKYLKSFSHETQFIVVTHRKGTMEEADVLYGVTMQESGVSNLMSVRLEESAALVEAK